MLGSFLRNDITLESLKNLGINVDPITGHLTYAEAYQPFELEFDLVFVRHGETYGNCGQITETNEIDETLKKDSEYRIFQGNVDFEMNKLTAEGEEQAKKVAELLDQDYYQKGWIPDVIFTSPLSRARNTALPFANMHGFKLETLDGIREMSFGPWDNRRVCDLPDDNICHTFYREQNSLVKNTGVNGSGQLSSGENFCEVILRAKEVLSQLNQTHKNKKVIMFSHSMFGAACCILLGKGQTIENGNYLAFDGKKADGSYYTMPHATPFHFDKPKNLNFIEKNFLKRSL